jgi:hypothetical protein
MGVTMVWSMHVLCHDLYSGFHYCWTWCVMFLLVRGIDVGWVWLDRGWGSPLLQRLPPIRAHWRWPCICHQLMFTTGRNRNGQLHAKSQAQTRP